MKILKWSAGIFTSILATYIAIALSMILWPEPDYFADHPIPQNAYQTMQAYSGVNISMDTPFTERTFKARDGETLFARHYSDTDNAQTTIIYLHGVTSKSAHLNTSAGLLLAQTHADIITPDLRGHDRSGGADFDIDYIGQYEDDLEDIILAVRADSPNQTIILAGHSMGGGIALRYALKPNAPSVDGYILLAPNMGEGPTKPVTDNSDPQTTEAIKAFFNFNTKRLIGGVMMNVLGIHAFDHKPIMYFNAPPEMPAYSYAAIISAQPNAPQDSQLALQAIKSPLLVIIGEEDEMFVATAYGDVVSANSKGHTIIVPNLNHNQLINDARTFEHVGNWYETLN